MLICGYEVYISYKWCRFVYNISLDLSGHFASKLIINYRVLIHKWWISTFEVICLRRLGCNVKVSNQITTSRIRSANFAIGAILAINTESNCCRTTFATVSWIIRSRELTQVPSKLRICYTCAINVSTPKLVLYENLKRVAIFAL